MRAEGASRELALGLFLFVLSLFLFVLSLFSGAGHGGERRALGVGAIKSGRMRAVQKSSDSKLRS